MIRFHVFGIPVEVQPFFWLTLAILGSYGNNNGSTSEGILKVLLFVLAGFFSVLVHELGHALTARYFGANTRIVLQAFGGYAEYAGVKMSRVRSFLITAAGPGTQIVLGILAMLVLSLLPRTTETYGHEFLGDLIRISFAWAILNLLPVLPLDGGQLLHAVLGPARIKITLWVSILAAMVAGVAVFMLANSILFPIFLAMFAYQAYQQLQALPRR